MSEELEAFLRRAAQKRQKRRGAEIVLIEPVTEPVAQPARAQPVAERPPLASSVSDPASVSSLPSSTPPGQPPPQQQKTSTERSRRKRPDKPKRLPSQDPARQQDESAHHLADHHWGNLDREAAESTKEAEGAPGASVAAEIARLLQTPGGVRRAFILQEILAPPVHRWDP